MSKNEFNHRQALAMGGGLMTGLGLGFFCFKPWVAWPSLEAS